MRYVAGAVNVGASLSAWGRRCRFLLRRTYLPRPTTWYVGIVSSSRWIACIVRELFSLKLLLMSSLLIWLKRLDLSRDFLSAVLLRVKVIVNLQKTPKDDLAAIVINAKIDPVMRCVMQELGIAIPVRGILTLSVEGIHHAFADCLAELQ